MRYLHSVASAGVIALAATASPAIAAVTFETFIPVPADTANVQPGGAFSSFDISFADPVTGNIFIADRSNASVDIFSGSSETFLGRATGFTGQQATTSVSGADGVLTVTSGGVTTLYAGDGNSTLKVFNATNPAAPSLLQSISTGGATRVDEMAYSPLSHQVLAANNAETPAYGNLFSTNNGHPPVTLNGVFPANKITVPTSQGGSMPAAWSSRCGIRKPERSSFPFRRWPGPTTQVGSPRSISITMPRSIPLRPPSPSSESCMTMWRATAQTRQLSPELSPNPFPTLHPSSCWQ